MKILFLSQLLPYPLDAGPKLRSYYVIRKLAEDHEVTLLAFSRDSDTHSSVQHLENICYRVITVPIQRSKLKDVAALARSVIKFSPFLIERDQSRQMVRVIINLAQTQHFDYVHADQLWMAQYALIAKNELHKHGKTAQLVIDQHNAVFQIPDRMASITRNFALKIAYKRESFLMARYELNICREFDHVVWVTKEDLNAVLQKTTEVIVKDALEKTSTIIPICIDLDNYPQPTIQSDSKDLLFIGGMHWPPNTEGVRWFVKMIFPQIQNHYPETRLWVVGKNPPKEIIFLDGVNAPGFVNDLTEYWQKGCVFVVPLLSGGGMRVKILDAWAHRTPVVSTTIGAEGIDYLNGENILICDEPQQFIDGVSELLDNPSKAKKIGDKGRMAVEGLYQWQLVYKAWDFIYDRALKN